MRIAVHKLCLAGLFTALGFCVSAQKVGFLLGSYVSDRWYLDQKLFTDRVKSLGGECVAEIAYDADEQFSLAKKLVDNGVDVLVVVPIDGVKAAAIARYAKASGVPTVAYDRLIMSNDISFYVSYDNEKVGRLQAEYMVSKFPRGKYLLINGPITDHNAVLFRKGQLDVLQPLIDRGDVTLLGDYVLSSWSEMSAFEKMREYISNGKQEPDVIIAANDAVANGVIQALPPQAAGRIAITGQDADLPGIRNIVAGIQLMTVYKPIKIQAYVAAEKTMELARGRRVKGELQLNTDSITVETIMLDPMVVDIKNYKETVIRDGHASLSEVVMNLGQAIEQERNKSQLSILQKEKALEIEKKENQRNVFVMVVVFFMVSIGGLAFTIYHKQRDNRLLQRHRLEIERKNQALLKTNDRLRMLNEELLQQQEEISSQRDAISHQKEKLQEVNTIIARQKDEILNQKETLEEEVEKRTAELVKYNRQLEQYAFITAHNLRAPVARIMGLGQIIKLQQSDPEEILDILEKLIGATQELDKVIKDLNRILDLRTVSVEFFTEVDLQSEMALIKENLRMEIEQTGASVLTEFDTIRSVFTIKPYIHSILFNLISNAIKYRNPERPPVIKVSTESSGDMICLSVADNGMGIDLEQHQDMLFQLYKRFHFHVEGRGLGLFLVKTQIESLGGSIKIESEVNKGTTFRVMLSRHARRASSLS